MTVKSESNNSTPTSTPPTTPIMSKGLKTPLLTRVKRAESFEAGVTDAKFITSKSR